MGSQWGRDKVYLQAKKHGYRSRAAYKIRDILRMYQVMRPEDNIIDLGAAPGSWLQILREETDGAIIGIDLNSIQPIDRVTTIVGDFTKPAVVARVKEMMPIVNLVVCDASPKISGQKSYDQARAMELNMKALEFTKSVLIPGGNLVMKSFQGEDFGWLYQKIKVEFFKVTTHKAQASRRGSTELYIIARNYRAGREDRIFGPSSGDELSEEQEDGTSR
ncbi:MAG TPA: RlmE family RNA methyltransferase [Methanospirillum sp.]|nr:RlmE family RNA methyltransferase [Methanospirillum sp.]